MSGYSWRYRCRCSCGTERDVEVYGLLSGKSLTCGCQRPSCRIDRKLEDVLGQLIIQDNGCHTWPGATNEGYGTVGFGKPRRRWLVHKLVYEHLVEPVPDGLELDHVCRNTLCANVDHLEPVTHRENILRGLAPPAVHAKKTQCPRGHKYTPENTRTDSKNMRHCRTCDRIHSLKRRPPIERARRRFVEAELCAMRYDEARPERPVKCQLCCGYFEEALRLRAKRYHVCCMCWWNLTPECMTEPETGPEKQ